MRPFDLGVHHEMMVEVPAEAAQVTSDPIRGLVVELNQLPVAAVQRARLGVEQDLLPPQQTPLELAHYQLKGTALVSPPPGHRKAQLEVEGAG